MTERFECPLFEIWIPACEDKNCNGIMIRHTAPDTKEIFDRCSVCGKAIPIKFSTNEYNFDIIIYTGDQK